MPYIDGFVLAVPKKKIKQYVKVARDAGKVWMEHGALQYRECVAEDVQPGKTTSFPQSVKAKSGEVVFFSYIVYKSRKHRDQVNKKVMADPRIASIDPKTLPFDVSRMIYGGFEVAVDM